TRQVACPQPRRPVPGRPRGRRSKVLMHRWWWPEAARARVARRVLMLLWWRSRWPRRPRRLVRPVAATLAVLVPVGVLAAGLVVPAPATSAAASAAPVWSPAANA